MNFLFGLLLGPARFSNIMYVSIAPQNDWLLFSFYFVFGFVFYFPYLYVVLFLVHLTLSDAWEILVWDLVSRAVFTVKKQAVPFSSSS